jgi:cytohesin
VKHIIITTIAAVVLVGCGPSVPDISIHSAAEKGNIEAVKQHIAAGTDVDAKDDGGWRPLHAATKPKQGHKEIVELLIAAGADVNAKSKMGTPLHVAARNGQKEITELLIAKGADVNVKGDSFPTPLHFASSWDHKEVVELLIANGADVNQRSDRGGTPLNAADGEIAELLRKHGGKTGEELKAEGK